MPGENQEQEIVNERDEAQADAGSEPEQDEVGTEGEDAAEGDGAESQEGEQEEIAAAEERRPSRGEVRFQKLSNEAREARERAERIEREFNEFRNRQQQQTTRESPEQEAQRLALMTPEERMEYRFDQAQRQNQQTMQAMAFQMQDTSDKSAFATLCMSDPVAAKYKDKVESELTRLRSQGQNVNREALLDYLIGRDVRAKRGPAADRQRKDGERRIARQTGVPSNSKGDSAPAKRGEKSLEEKLANVTF